MVKYFYLVEFSYFVSEGCESSFDLGVFSTKKKAVKKVEMSSYQQGFKDYPIDNFKITKFRVCFDNDIKDKSKVTLYSITHTYQLKDDKFTDYWSIFDYVSTYEKACEKIEYLRLHSRIGKRFPNNFEIVKVLVDNYNSWSEGFEKLTEICKIEK